MIALTGNDAAAEAMRQIEPDVVPMYPITPQSPLVQKYARFHAEGLVKSQLITAESEHSVMSAAVGASAAGARVMTATSSAGLAYMFEVLGVASGLRLPIVLSVVTRALSAPINVHCDHSDIMGVRDSGWLQIFSENPQEVYENTIIALKLAEATNIPVMSGQDGFVCSHALSNVNPLGDKNVKDFVGEYNPEKCLLKDDYTIGPLVLPDYFMEIKKLQEDAVNNSYKTYEKIAKEAYQLFNRDENPFIEDYKASERKNVIVVMGASAGTIKDVIDTNKDWGLLKIKLHRPFPYDEVAKVLKNAEKIIVFDRADSPGALTPLTSEICTSLSKNKLVKDVYPIVHGLGGRDVTRELVTNLFKAKLNPYEKTFWGLK